MREFLQIVGSVASILGVPLGCYFYIKGRVQRYAIVRREIVKRLSHQIGEGRAVGLFELNAVIDSLVRDCKLREGSISSDSVIQDLVAETVSSPLLDSKRKEQLIGELSSIHSHHSVYQAIVTNFDAVKKFLEGLGTACYSADEPEELKRVAKTKSEIKRDLYLIPNLFFRSAAVIAGMTAAVWVVGIIEEIELLPKVFNSELITPLLLGIGASIAATVIALVVSKKKPVQ